MEWKCSGHISNPVIIADGSVCLLVLMSKQLQLLNWYLFCFLPDPYVWNIKFHIRTCVIREILKIIIGLSKQKEGVSNLKVSRWRYSVTLFCFGTEMCDLDILLCVKWVNETKKAQADPVWSRQVTLESLEKSYWDTTERQEPKRIFTLRQWITVLCGFAQGRLLFSFKIAKYIQIHFYIISHYIKQAVLIRGLYP